MVGARGVRAESSGSVVVETLLNLHAAPRMSSLGRLADVLAHVDNLSHALAWAKGDGEQQTYHASNKGSGEQWFHVHITAGSESSDGTGGWSYVPSVGAATSHFSEGTSGVGLLGPVVREDRLFDSTGMQGRGLPTRI